MSIMRLIRDDHSPAARSDGPRPVGSPFYLIQKRLKQYILTEAGLSSVIAALSVILITGILASHYLQDASVLSSRYGNRDIMAEKTLQVVDTEATERLRYEARQLISPVYKRQADMETMTEESIQAALQAITAVRDRKDLSLEAKIQIISRTLNLREPMSRPALEVLLTIPNWPHFTETVQKTGDSLIARGVMTEELRTRGDFLITRAIPATARLSQAEEEALRLLLEQTLQPTLMIDEVATEEVKDLAAARIKPVVETFYKGEVIVRKGQKITQLQRDALGHQGTLSHRNQWLSMIGVAILCVCLLTIVWGYVYRFEHSNFFKPAYCSLLAVMMILAIGSLTLLVHFDQRPMVEFFPISMMSLMVCIFTHPRIAILTTMMVLLLCGLTLKIPLDILAVLVVACMVGIFILSRKHVPHDRNDLVLAGLGVGITQAVMIWSVSFIYEPPAEMLHLSLLLRVFAGILSGLIAGSLTLGQLPLFEWIFKLVTPYTLLELGNHDRPILKRMQLEAPGTFHHSVMVATLSEAAAEVIGANPILARVGALYHDIGKIKRPLFFVENQAYFGIENPHDKLTPRLSKMVITAHPRDGVEMGKQLGLPQVILRFMPEHHGTLLAGYFYNKAVLQEGEENVNKTQFRYPGPKPQSKETAIVMMADACESSVRALKSPTVAQVEERIDKIIHQRIEDQQFTECPITLQEIQMIRDTFVRVLRGIQHNRIEYQQNVLQELGKKTIANELKQVTASLQQAESEAVGKGGGSVSAAAVAGDAPNLSSESILIELDSLAELQEKEDGGPDCC